MQKHGFSSIYLIGVFAFGAGGSSCESCTVNTALIGFTSFSICVLLLGLAVVGRRDQL